MELKTFIKLLLMACEKRTKDASTEAHVYGDIEASVYYMGDVQVWINTMETAQKENMLKIPEGSGHDLDYHYNLDYLFQITDTYSQYGHLASAKEIAFT